MLAIWFAACVALCVVVPAPMPAAAGAAKAGGVVNSRYAPVAVSTSNTSNTAAPAAAAAAPPAVAAIAPPSMLSLADRHRQLCRECITAMGKEPFRKAYLFLQSAQDDVKYTADADGGMKDAELRKLLGQTPAVSIKIPAWRKMIEQILFMEHS